MDPIFSQQFDYAKPKPKGGMFGGGKVQIDLGRALAGYLAGIGNQAGVQALQAMNETRQRQLSHQQELDDYNRKLTDDQTDWRTQYDYELAHPKPGQPGEFEDALIASGVQPGSPEWVKAMQQRVGNILDPAIVTPQGMMLRSQVMGAMAPPTAPVGKLTPIGGPTPQASGGFLGASY